MAQDRIVTQSNGRRSGKNQAMMKDVLKSPVGTIRILGPSGVREIYAQGDAFVVESVQHKKKELE